MKAQIISIGNELLIGDTVNTNARWLGDFLTALGFDVRKVITLTDDLKDIKLHLAQSLKESDLVITTGGLGPTHDDMTKKAVCELYEVGLKKDEKVLSFIRDMFEKRNIPFSKSNEEQAMIPENAEVLFNKAGTAPGMWISDEKGCLAVLPGVPYEMKYLMKKRVAGRLREQFGEVGYVHSEYIHTAGVGESTLSDEILGDLSDYFTNGVSLAYLPGPSSVTLRITVAAPDKEEAIKEIQHLKEIIYDKAGDYIYGEGKNYTISEAVGELLRNKKLMMSVAESCTGGLIADSITNIPGSSDYMKGGIVAYANEAKINLLNVDEKDLDNHGAVSKEVALQMAEGVAQALNTTIGISTTGIAGPGGGSEEKPVGTVWIGLYYKDQEHFAVKARFTKDRMLNKKRSETVALEILRRALKGIDPMPYNLEKQYA